MPSRAHIGTSFRDREIFAIIAVALLSIAAKPRPTVRDDPEARYLSPGEIVSPDGRRLYVVCEESDEVRVVDTQSSKSQRIAVGHMPRELHCLPTANSSTSRIHGPTRFR